MATKKSRLYVAIIDDGLSVRSFKDLVFMCELFNLDAINVRKHLNDKGYWCGLRMTVFKSELETRFNHNGRF
jgi:hypothetical protein